MGWVLTPAQVARLVDALAPYCASMNVPDSPFVLRLPNVMHLASDVTGAVRPPTNGDPTPSSLTLAAALHPTAAVGGTPTRAAVRILARAEGADRGRYAGPVGWIAADGDGGGTVTPDRGHHVDHLAGRDDVVRAEDGRAQPTGDRRGGGSARR